MKYPRFGFNAYIKSIYMFNLMFAFYEFLFTFFANSAILIFFLVIVKFFTFCLELNTTTIALAAANYENQDVK